MAGFFSTTHEAFPVTETTDLEFCKGSIDSVSFSGLTTYESCPYQLYLNKVSKIPGISGPAADRGSIIHNALEEYVLGTAEMKWNLLKSKVYYKYLVDAFKEDYDNGLCIPELKFAITKKMKHTTWDADDMWLRGAIDVVIFETPERKRASIYDYKSGRNSSSVKHRSQLMLYAMMMFLMYPKLQNIQAAPVYVDHAANVFYTNFKREDFDTFWPRFNDRFNKITDATHFPPNSNQFSCRFCQHAKPQESLEQVVPACEFGYV